MEGKSAEHALEDPERGNDGGFNHDDEDVLARESGRLAVAWRHLVSICRRFGVLWGCLVNVDVEGKRADDWGAPGS